MSKGQGIRLKVPGSCLERVQYFIWYEVIMGTWIGILALWAEIFHSMQKCDYNAIPKHSGQTAVLTGGTRGIGLKVLKKLLQLDYQVICGVRDIDAGRKAIEGIRSEGISSGQAKCKILDLKSLKSVQIFSQNVLNEVDRLDLLINNAGVMLVPYNLTEDGYEVHFQVNHLSHFLITQMLLPKMRSTALTKSTNCRVVNVSSIAHNGSSAVNITDMANPNVYSPLRAYADSKLSQILFSKYQDAQLKSEGAGVNIYSIHPGAIITDLYANVAYAGIRSCLTKIFRRSTDDGADVVMYAAISPDLEGEGGLYIINKRRCNPSKVTEDLVVQKQLWDLSHSCIQRIRLMTE